MVYLSGRRKGGLLKEEVWFESGQVVKYSIAYINAGVSSVDNGRVLGYDNSHGVHHRHFKGEITGVTFVSYEALVARFEAELSAVWREEDGEEA